MKLVIDIPDQKYKWIVDNPQTYTDDLCEIIRNGTPLPKGHGRIIDEDKIGEFRIGSMCKFMTNAPTIIEGSDSE